MSQPQFRYDLHKNSPALGNLIRNVERHGYYYMNQMRYKLVDAKKDGDTIKIIAEPY